MSEKTLRRGQHQKIDTKGQKKTGRKWENVGSERENGPAYNLLLFDRLSLAVFRCFYWSMPGTFQLCAGAALLDVGSAWRLIQSNFPAVAHVTPTKYAAAVSCDGSKKKENFWPRDILSHIHAWVTYREREGERHCHRHLTRWLMPLNFPPRTAITSHQSRHSCHCLHSITAHSREYLSLFCPTNAHAHFRDNWKWRMLMGRFFPLWYSLFLSHIHKIYLHSTVCTRNSQKLELFDTIFTLRKYARTQYMFRALGSPNTQHSALVNWYFFPLSGE